MVEFLPEGWAHTEYLIPAKEVLKAYEDELSGTYDKELLEYILLYFHGRFRWYATVCVFHDDPRVNKKVRANYAKYQKKIEESFAPGISAQDKMVLIDTLINIQHRGGSFATKLISDFRVFIQKRRLLDERAKQGLNNGE